MASDSDEEETFVTYGTPVEILEEDAPRKKPTLIEDQVVTDKQGRQRFHGAFSGGFSAGYFNTVGSEKGWAPSTFVSSRSQKHGKTQQRPEDFMDEDDFGEFGIAPRKITTTDTYEQLNESEIKKKRGWHGADGGVIPGQAPLHDLIQPVRESVGIQLLRKMGWRHGQGIGPKQKKKRAAKKIYGCSLPQAEEGQSSEDEFAQEYYFAPKDIESFKFRAKDNLHGIGYKGIDARTAMFGGHESINLFEDQSIPSKSSSGKRGIRGTAFGVGAFEDQDDDIYTVDHMSNYDQFIGDEIPSSVGSKTSNSKTKFFNACYVSKILEGFTLSANPRPPNKVYPPPNIPRDYKPYHVMKDIQPAGPKFKSKLFTMGAIQRGALLGEEQLPAPEVQPVVKKPAGNPTKSTVHPSQAPKQTPDSEVSKHATPDNKPVDIAAVVASLVSAQRAKMESRFAKPSQPVTTESPSVSVPSAGSSTFGFKPFAKDPAKQQRYEKFLASKGKSSDNFLTGEADTITEWERRREHDEFTRASILYKPLSSTMASRFTPAKHADDDDSKVDVKVDQESEKGHHAKAAEMKMFGRLTRDTFDWHPDRLLCKRFNIPDPYPGSSIVGLPTVKKDKISLYNFMSVPSHEESHVSEKQQPKQPSPEPQTIPERKTLPIFKSGGIFSNFTPVQKATVTEVPDSKPEDEEPVEEKRPPMDLFKAIFQDESSEDSEESSSEEEDEQMEDRDENETKKREEKEVTQDQIKKGSEEINEIFPAAARDEHLTIPQSSLSMKEHNKTPEVEKKTVNVDVYGPALPPPSNESNAIFSSSSNQTRDIVDPHRHKHLYVSKDERNGKRNKDKNYRREKSSEETSKRHSSHEHLEKKQKHKHRKKEKHTGKHKKEKKSKKSKHSSKPKHDARKRLRSDSERETSTDSYSSDNW